VHGSSKLLRTLVVQDNRHFLLNVLLDILLGVLLAVLIAGLVGPGWCDDGQSSGLSSNSAWQEQVEKDWLRAEERRSSRPHGPTVLPEEDALGGCDGEITGKWGFHTENEERPWWQVDLGQIHRLTRVVLYNRCDSCGERNCHIILLLSQDGSQWQQAYQHDGTLFLGHSDGKPLVISLPNLPARFVRLQLPGKSYFHLDEVEVYGEDHKTNLALWKPATQSSVSPWSVRHSRSVPFVVGPQVLEQTLKRGLKLAECLAHSGLDVRTYVAELEAVNRAAGELSAGERQPGNEPFVAGPTAFSAPDVDRWWQLYRRARWAIRRMALANPLLDFDRILFVKRVPPAFPHMSDQYYGWWARPGGGLYLLEGFRSDIPVVRCLTEGWPLGSFLDPDISYDGRKVVFSFARHYPGLFDVRDKVNKENLPEDAFYHIFEMNLDGSGLRQLTRGKYDDFSPRYLPCGDIVFLSTRKGKGLQVRPHECPTNRFSSLPDSYVRCGGDNWRPVPVFTLHRLEPGTQRIYPISAFENFEWTPAIGHDSRILYARWDYIDRFNGPFISLWATDPDGTNAQLVYGNFTSRPQCVFEARPVPGSTKLLFTASAHHSNLGGSLVLLDRSRGTEFERPLERVTPEVCFPETEGWPEHYYVNPYPLSEDFYLVAWSDRPLPQHFFVIDERNPVNPTGIYLLDRFGNLELLHRDGAIGSFYPLPVRPRPVPPVISETVVPNDFQKGSFFLLDVYRGLEPIPRGTIKRLRIVAVPPKVQPHMNTPVLGVSREDPGKYVLGTVPVYEDGSAWFEVPSGIPVFFQALDEQGMAVQTMRSLAYVQPGETQSCIGCHEPRDHSPPASREPVAWRFGPVKPALGPEGSWPLRFDRLVQPVLDRYCVDCHRSDAADPKARAFDLSAPRSYEALIHYADDDLFKLAFEKDRSIPGDCPARKSKLLSFLTQPQGHAGITLDAESLERLITWMDTYAQRLGHFSDEQEGELEQLRAWWIAEGSDVQVVNPP